MMLSSEGKMNFLVRLLGASQADLADEKLKSQALSREQEDALRAEGGSVLRRIVRHRCRRRSSRCKKMPGSHKQDVAANQNRSGMVGLLRM